MSTQPMRNKKILSMHALKKNVARARKDGCRIVATNGVFDMFHFGHLHSLVQAKSHGDYLIVGVNSDASVRRLKGPHRPLVPEMERAHMLAALSCVDAVVLFHEDTAHAWLSVCRPDVYVKGSDRTIDQILERRMVEECGGRVVLVPHTKKHSTTKLIDKILKTYTK